MRTLPGWLLTSLVVTSPIHATPKMAREATAHNALLVPSALQNAVIGPCIHVA